MKEELGGKRDFDKKDVLESNLDRLKNVGFDINDPVLLKKNLSEKYVDGLIALKKNGFSSYFMLEKLTDQQVENKECVDIFSLKKLEEERQKNTIDLIASENVTSEKVSELLGSVFVNKYAEGYPHKRYYAGNEFVDEVELMCQQKAKEVFGLSDEWEVNVQPLSGAIANLAVYYALVPKGGKITGLALNHGGHLTHGGLPITISGKFYDTYQYELDKDGLLDYDAILKQAKEVKPDLIIAGFSAYSRSIDWEKFRNIADEVGAKLMVDMAHIAGLVAGGAHSSPFPYADVVTTTTHKTLRGPRAAMIFSKGEETAKKVNKAIFPGIQGGPHINKIAALVQALDEAKSPEFKEYARNLVENASAMAEVFKSAGYNIVSGGTDNHLFIVDLGDDGVDGATVQDALEKNGIIVNKNMTPFDKRPPTKTSGIRLGSPAETSKGKTKADFENIAKRIIEIIEGIER